MISKTLVSVCLIDSDRLIQVWLYYAYGICHTDSILQYVRSVIVTMTPTLVDHILRAHQEPQTAKAGKKDYSCKFYVKMG